VQSRDLERARKVAARIRAGQVLINYPAWSPFAAFGGYKRSGTGASSASRDSRSTSRRRRF
jgi:aldehyde dehydrogenase (NAD+)